MYEERTTYTTRTEYVPAFSTVECRATPDASYLRTLPGMLKLLILALNFLVFFCLLVGGPGYYTGVGFATFVSTFGFTITLILLLLYLFHIVDMMPNIPWIVGEMVYCFAWAIFYFIAASVLAVATANYRGTFFWGVAAFFAIAALCAYGFDAYLKFLAWKRDEKATGAGVSYGPRRTNEHV